MHTHAMCNTFFFRGAFSPLFSLFYFAYIQFVIAGKPHTYFYRNDDGDGADCYQEK